MQNSQAVYQRMQTERQREAAEFRAQGSEKSQEIRARADRDVTVLIADATQGGEQARGDGDADRARIFARPTERTRSSTRFIVLCRLTKRRCTRTTHGLCCRRTLGSSAFSVARRARRARNSE
jgi:hypothetical protein